jgi:phage terminase large subunit-like protein
MRQGAITMMPAIKELDRAITGERLRHGGHPVLRWNFENTEVETNSLGHLVRLTKSKRKLPIDGTVATAMAVARASAGETKYLKYDPIILEAA